MTSLTSTSQCRTLTHVYLFKAKDEYNIVLKIYDLSQKCISKTTLTYSQLGFSNVKFTLEDPTILLDTLRQKNLLPPENSPSVPTVEECLKDIEHIINQIKPKVLFESKKLEKFSCSITLEVFKDPVIDNHGHTFEKSAIEEHLKSNKTCPLNRDPITSLIPNLEVKQFIEEAQKKDPIPTFALFKKENTQLAANNLKMAQDYIEAEEYDEALTAYAKAFQYTQKWTDYQQLRHLYEKMDQKDKARLATLYLIQYQLQDKKITDALQTLEELRKSDPQLIQISPLLIKLYRYTQQTQKAITFALEIGETLSKEHPQEALLVYKQIISQDPYQWKAYTHLATLIKEPHEKAHILLKGATHAIQKKDHKRALNLCQEAEKLYQDSFVDRLIELDLLTRQKKPTKEKLHQIASTYEEKNLSSPMIKAYRMLASLEYAPTYYEKIIEGYDQINKPEKALQWTLKWLTHLIEKKEWKQAEKLTLNALKRTDKKIPLYEQLETIYTHWNGHELSNLWGKLAQAYIEDKQLAQAEKTYQKAFKQFNTFEHAIALADVLIKEDKKQQGVQTYYEASSIALLKNRMDDLTLCVKNIQKTDPEMKYLKLSQKMHLLTQSRIVELSNEVKLLKEQINPPQKIVVQEVKKETALPTIAFGAAKWATYFGDVGIEPPLPSNINQILKSPCPFFPGKTVGETHLLTLIPKTVNGKPLTLNSLNELVQKPKQGNATRYCSYWDEIKKLHGDTPVQASYWVLFTKDVIPGSRSKNYDTQKQLVADLSKKANVPYEVPFVLESSTSIFMEYVQSGTRLYSGSPWTFTRCQDKRVSAYPNFPLVVGVFSSSGLIVDYRDNGDSEHNGVGGSRKLN